MLSVYIQQNKLRNWTTHYIDRIHSINTLFYIHTIHVIFPIVTFHDAFLSPLHTSYHCYSFYQRPTPLWCQCLHQAAATWGTLSSTQRLVDSRSLNTLMLRTAQSASSPCRFPNRCLLHNQSCSCQKYHEASLGPWRVTSNSAQTRHSVSDALSARLQTSSDVC